ncbi:MAG: hypothetical protein AAGA03_08070 [Planctomycetota bacterium]
MSGALPPLSYSDRSQLKARAAAAHAMRCGETYYDRFDSRASVLGCGSLCGTRHRRPEQLHCDQAGNCDAMGGCDSMGYHGSASIGLDAPVSPYQYATEAHSTVATGIIPIPESQPPTPAWIQTTPPSQVQSLEPNLQEWTPRTPAEQEPPRSWSQFVPEPKSDRPDVAGAETATSPEITPPAPEMPRERIPLAPPGKRQPAAKELPAPAQSSPSDLPLPSGAVEEPSDRSNAADEDLLLDTRWRSSAPNRLPFWNQANARVTAKPTRLPATGPAARPPQSTLWHRFNPTAKSAHHR